jgi:sigma-B regulation protein RsbU (phosphoserine phosphatase)
MNSLQTEFWDMTSGLLVAFIGLASILISLFRLKRKDFSLLNFGLFFLIYGIRWLLQTSTIRALLGFPSPMPYFPFTYLFVIPFAAFLVDILGPGLYNSMRWVFRLIVLYVVVSISMDLIYGPSSPDPEINPVLVVILCIVTAARIIFAKGRTDVELRVVRAVFGVSLIATMHDQLVNMRVLPWSLHLEHPGFLVLCLGLAFVAAHHFLLNERKLFAVEQEIEIARRIQNSNLPSGLSSPEGIDIAARYVPMSTVAGDFYDVQVSDKKGAGILVADVSGHGVGAALIGSMLKIAFASQARHIADPAKILTEINRTLQGKIEQSFVTACCVYIDTENAKLHYANAGHPPALVWNTSKNRLHRCPATGTILGSFPDAVYANATADFGRGDRLLFYTDGIIEARDGAGEFFGEERLVEFMESHASEPADRVADELIEHLSKWSGKSRRSSLDDDLTLVIVDNVAEPAGS